MHAWRPLLLLLMALLACPPLLWSKTVTVSAGGSINNGIRQLSAGDTLEVDDGTYSETLDTNSIANGSSNNPTIVKAKNMRKVVLRPSGNGPIASFHGKQGIVYDGFVHDGSQMGTSGGGLDLNAQNGLRDILIQNLEIHHIKGDTQGGQGNYLTTAAIGASYTAQNVVLQHLYVHDIGDNQQPGNSCNECYGYGIYLSGNGYTLQNSRFENIAGWVVHGYSSGSPAASDNTILNNVMTNTGGPILLCQNNNTIVGNILQNVGMGATGGSKGGIVLNFFCSGQPARGNVIANNTIVDSAGACLHLGGASATTVKNNICWHNAPDAITGGGGGNSLDHNLLGQDPMFVNASGGDYHLRPGSPAMHAGTPMPGVVAGAGAPNIGACQNGVPCGVGAGGSTPAPSGPAPPQNLRVVTQP